MRGHSEYIAKAEMQLNKETYVRETHKVSITVDGREHTLLSGT